MKTQDLQQPYRALAEMRREQSLNTEKGDFLNDAFTWVDTKEGGDFWCDLLTSNTPEIPAESLAELKEWQKGKQCFDCKGDIDKDGQCFCNKEFEAVLIAEQPKEEPDPRLFTAAVAAMQGVIANENTDEFASFYKISKKEAVSIISWDYAESLINEGKKRNLL